MFTLRAEIVACLFAVSLLGLLAGWMMQRARLTRKLDEAVEQWEAKHAALEQSTRENAQNLERRLQLSGDELTDARNENRELRESARLNDVTAEAARTESIEMNRRHAEVQERLQQTLRQQECEIATLREAMSSHDDTLPESPTPRSAAYDGRAEALDETIRIDPTQLPGAGANAPAGSMAQDLTAMSDEVLDKTLSVEFLDAEESTIALDDEALAMVHGLQGGRKR